MSNLWYACEQPEREPDAFVRWHYEHCATCQFKAEVQQRLHPDDPHVTWLVQTIHGSVL
jgi:hypothetical protein